MWVFNVFLYLMFLTNQEQYKAFVAAGATCYSYVSTEGERPSGNPPACFYLEKGGRRK